MADVMCLGGKTGMDWAAIHGDCVDVVRQLPDQSVGYSIYSPPFLDVFSYSDSESDMGNNATEGEFVEHYTYLVRELVRVMKPGRLVSVHCSDIPYTKWKDGLIAINPFSDTLNAIHRAAGFVLHCRTTVWKDPVVEMTRTKALGLLHKQILKDSTRSRTGMPDYILTFRAPGVNAEPVGHDEKYFPVTQWQQWASPVWMDIRQTDTLNVRIAKGSKDEKHVCPLQLGLIERALHLWSNPGDTVLSPFMGIGSEGVMSMETKRRFLGVELKEEYFDAACKYIDDAERSSASLFDRASA